jgi:hypothetical protein
MTTAATVVIDLQVTNDDGMSALDLMDESDSAAIKAISASRNFNMELFNKICHYEVTSEEV